MDIADIPSRQQFLERYYDPKLEPPETTIKELEDAQVARLTRALVVVMYTGSIPRRLGGDATGPELAADKKRSRRVAHAIKQSLHGWQKSGYKLPEGEELRIEGTQIIWHDWYGAYLTDLASQTTLLVTWSIRNEERRWGRSAVVRFENERNWIIYAMRG